MGMVIKGRQVLIIQVGLYFLLLLSASNYCCESCGVGRREGQIRHLLRDTVPKLIVDNLPKLFRIGLIHVTHLKLLPYGNANLYNGTIYCQNTYFPFINCMENVVLESFVYRRKYPQWRTCFEELNLEAKSVIDCLKSVRGRELEFLYAAGTTALQPPQTYVPWVIVDGQPLYENYENFISYICKAYKGTAAVPACNASVKVIQKGRKIKRFGSTKLSNSKLFTVSSVISSWMKKLISTLL